MMNMMMIDLSWLALALGIVIAVCDDGIIV
jgi:hypothetical protein